MRPLARCLASLVALAACAVTPRSSAAAPGGPVIAPGQEALLGQMLGSGTPLGDCSLDDAAVDKSRVVATYLCGAAKAKAVLRLEHPDEASSAVKNAKVKTAAFAIVPDEGAPPPAALLDAVAARIRSLESGWKWTVPRSGYPDGKSSAPTLEDVVGVPPVGAGSSLNDGRSPEIDAEYVKGLALYRQKKYEEAFELYYALAHKEPRHGVLGMLVAALASTHPTKARTEELMAAADGKPDDVLAQFVAGVAAHYYAHQSGATSDEKTRYYKATLQYLARANPALDFEPRLFIYLAVSNYRLGHQKEAEALIEKAVALGGQDPDAFYCRAEIFQKTNLKRSLEDLDAYLRIQEQQKAMGAVVSPEKLARVKEMQKYLLGVSRGEIAPTELFDPTGSSSAQALASPRSFGKGVLLAALAAVALSAAAALASRRRRRREGAATE
jgi:tetratricopeptide (TPR) repeat protein